MAKSEREGKKEKREIDDQDEDLTRRKAGKSENGRSSKRKAKEYSESETESGSSETGESGSDRKRSRNRRHRSGGGGSRRRSRKRVYSDEESGSESGYSSTESDGSDSEESDSEGEGDEGRRKKRRERRKREEKEKEKERKRRRREKERKRRKREAEDEKRKKKKEKERDKKRDKKGKGKAGPVTDSWGKYGILRETDMWNKRPEFTAWLAEVKQVNLESLANWEEKKMFKEFMEDYNTATFPSRKYYGLDAYHRQKMEKQMKRGIKKVLQKERTIFNDEEQRRQELLQEREKAKDQQVEALKYAMQSGMAQAMKEQALLREEMSLQYKLGNFEAAAAIQRKLDPDAAM